MPDVRLQPASRKKDANDLEEEIARVNALLEERREELSLLQEEFQKFKVRYTQVVGSRLAELDEIEREIKVAECRLLGETESADEAEDADAEEARLGAVQRAPMSKGLRKLFWTVARLFHPDHATDEEEARRRHGLMAEASRAYREGDVDSLHALLSDDELQLYCAGPLTQEDDIDLSTRVLRLKEELLTIEFGIKRIKQNALYRLKLKSDEESHHGRDVLVQMAESLARQIAKAQNRLAHLS